MRLSTFDHRETKGDDYLNIVFPIWGQHSEQNTEISVQYHVHLPLQPAAPPVLLFAICDRCTRPSSLSTLPQSSAS